MIHVDLSLPGDGTIMNDYPHTCTACGHAAYLGGENNVECSRVVTGGRRSRSTKRGNAGDKLPSGPPFQPEDE